MKELDIVKWYKIFYKSELQCTSFVSFNEMFVNINDLQYLLNDEYCFPDISSQSNYMSNNFKYNVIELFEHIPDSKYFYAKIDTTNLFIGELNNHYITIDKISSKNIISIEKMKSLQSFIESENEDKIFETLLSSLENNDFKSIIEKFVGIDNIVKNVGSKSSIKDSITFTTDKQLSDTIIWKELLSLCNLAGYTISENNLGKFYRYICTPYHGELANNIVYDKNNGIVYHLTSEYWYNKIKNKKFIPFRSEFGWDDKSRIYCFSDKMSEHLEDAVCEFKRMSERQFALIGKIKNYYKKNVLLEIDLNLSDDKIDFYHDSAFKCKSNPVYTKDNILVNCITKIYRVKEFSIDKNYEII